MKTTLTGRTPSHPEMQRIRLAPPLFPKRELPPTDYTEIEARVAAWMKDEK